jgi:hypothetical protein
MADWARARDHQSLAKFLGQTSSVSSMPRNVAPQLRTDQGVGVHDPRSFGVQAAQERSVVSLAVHPWRRYFARFWDIYFFGIIFFFVLGFVFPNLFDTGESKASDRTAEQLWGMLVVLAYVPFEALCTNVFGTTLGKALYGIRVGTETNEPLTLSTAIKRSLAVWVRGWGLGIPIVALFTLVVAYRNLKKDGRTTWDRDFSCKVSHDSLSGARWFLIAIVWILSASIYAVLLSL